MARSEKTIALSKSPDDLGKGLTLHVDRLEPCCLGLLVEVAGVDGVASVKIVAASSDDGRRRGGTVAFLVWNDVLAVSSRVERPTIALIVADPRLIEVFRVLLHELYGHVYHFPFVVYGLA